MEASLEPPSLSSMLPDYYLEIDNERIARAFKDFDDPGNFERADVHIRSYSTKNAVVDFGDDEAYCATNLNAHDMEDILSAPRPTSLHTRWINIWAPHKQKDTLYNIAKHYDFTPRLLALMSTDPPRPMQDANIGKSHSSLLRRARETIKKPPKDPAIDLEKMMYDENSLQDSLVSSMKEESRSLHDLTNHWQIVRDVWHWSSSDWGRRYVCIGYNSLYPVDAPRQDHVGENAESNDLPEGIRVWRWLILTEDKTVVSICEDPFPYSGDYLNASEQRITMTIRHNLVNVFRQLSKAHDCTNQDPMTILPIRHRIGQTVEETAHRSSDAPGLLFFFLFEDWFSAFNLVARREYRYAAELDKLRRDMLVKAELRHINRLHHIGKQLAVLKRLYQSYELLIDRLLEKQEATPASLKNSHVAQGPDSLQSSRHHVLEAESLLGASLSSAAKVRFARMRVAIRLYAIAEIQECLDEKEQLVMMNFNLIAIKESLSVERLTRITLLLAKLTMLFLPVSLMTAYFGSELTDSNFTIKQYWTWFGVVFGVSMVVLWLFSVFSGTMEGKMLYRSFSRRMLDFVGQKMRRSGKRHD